jgi:transposase-like protein
MRRLSAASPRTCTSTSVRGRSKGLAVLARKRYSASSSVAPKTAQAALRQFTVHIPNVRRKTLAPEVRAAVEPGATIYTDALKSYLGLSDAYTHETVDHAIEFVRGNVHTNNVENFWSLLKRTLKGTYVSVDPVHLGRYLDEQAFRFNERNDNDGGRFRKVASSVAGKRLTYKDLIRDGGTPTTH